MIPSFFIFMRLMISAKKQVSKNNTENNDQEPGSETCKKAAYKHSGGKTKKSKTA